jgi:hypothetical protein
MNESEPIYAQDPQFEQALYRFELEENLPGQNFARVIVSFLFLIFLCCLGTSSGC